MDKIKQFNLSQRNRKPKQAINPWTEKEIDKLVNLVRINGYARWKFDKFTLNRTSKAIAWKLSEFVKHPEKLAEKHKDIIQIIKNTKISTNHVPWSEEENKKVKKLVSYYGNNVFQIQKYFEYRTRRSVREKVEREIERNMMLH